MLFRIGIILLVSCFTALAAGNFEANIQMLNYVGSLSERIKDKKEDPLELQNFRDEIYNNIIKTEIDSRTLGILSSLQESIKDFTLISRQKERMQIIIDNKKAEALSKAIPDPQFLISTALSKPNPYLMVANIGAMIASSVTSYQASMASADMEELKMNWEIEDKYYNAFESQSKEAWEYSVKVANKYGIEKSINEKMVQKFIELEKDDVIRRLKDLENPEIFTMYSEIHYQPYYLALSEAYYQNQNWKKCVQAYKDYEKNPVRLFIKDRSAAQMLPKIMDAALKYMGDSEKIEFLKEYNEKFIRETSDEDWELRYFAALNYMNLSGLDTANRKFYLRKAFDVFDNNVSKLSKRQDSLVAKYILPIDEVIPKSLTDEQKKAHKAMIKLEKKERKAQALPLDKALYTNMEMALAIAKQDRDLSQKWAKLIPVVRKSIVNAQLRKKYGLDIKDFSNTSFDGKYFNIPVTFVSPELKISMKVTDKKNRTFTLKDIAFEIKRINRVDDDLLIKDSKDEKFIEQLNNFKAEIKLQLKPYKIDFDEVKSVLFYLEAYGETIQIPLVNVDETFVVNKIK